LAGDYDAWLGNPPDQLFEDDEAISIGPQENARQRIFQAVVERGFLKGWTMEQFAARQVAKLQEELGELAACFIGDSHPQWTLNQHIRTAALRARIVFKHTYGWNKTRTTPDSIKEAKIETSDLYVVLCCIEAALNEIDGPYDMEQAALDKALADVERGTR
jgi:hypothetical protein